MECQKFETDPCSSLLQQLQEQGFKKWVTLPSRQGFFSALAFGLLLHAVPTYLEYAEFMRRTWMKNVEPLLEVDEAYTKWWGERRYLYPLYWMELGKKCMELCKGLFLEQGKDYIAQRLTAEGCLDLSNKLLISSIASYFNSCICIYECVDSYIRTMEFYEMQEGKFATIVCMAVENEEISVLIHRDFAFDLLLEEAFPNYVKLTKSRDQQTRALWLEDEERCDIQPHSETPAVVNLLTTMAEDLAEVAKSVNSS